MCLGQGKQIYKDLILWTSLLDVDPLAEAFVSGPLFPIMGYA